MPNRDKLPRGPFLEETVTVPVRFHEVDVMRVVWHGWYCAYFEDARVALGRRFGVSYEAIAGQGFMAPIVRLQCEFCAPARYGDVLSVTARLYPREAAKLEFGYLVHRSSDARLLACEMVVLGRGASGERFTRGAVYDGWRLRRGVARTSPRLPLIGLAGVVGVALAPADQGCRPTHERFVRVLEWCAEHGTPVFVNNPGLTRRESVMEFARPSLLDDALRGVEGLTIVLGDLGRVFLDEALILCTKHERCFAEISTLIRRPGALYGGLLAAHECQVAHKLLFGSGFPGERPERAIERLYSANSVTGGPVGGGGGGWPMVPREALRGIVERDALRALGVDAIVGGPAGPPAPARRTGASLAPNGMA